MNACRQDDACDLCKVATHDSRHHLVPKSRNGSGFDKARLCRPCHDTVHALLRNKDLERSYN